MALNTAMAANTAIAAAMAKRVVSEATAMVCGAAAMAKRVASEAATEATAVQAADEWERAWRERFALCYFGSRRRMREKGTWRTRQPPPAGATMDSIFDRPAEPSASIKIFQWSDGYLVISWQDTTHANDPRFGGDPEFWRSPDNACYPNDYHHAMVEVKDVDVYNPPKLCWPDSTFDPVTESLVFVCLISAGGQTFEESWPQMCICGIVGKDGTATAAMVPLGIGLLREPGASRYLEAVALGSRNWVAVRLERGEFMNFVNVNEGRRVECGLNPGAVQVVSHVNLVVRGTRQSPCERAMQFVQVSWPAGPEPVVEVLFTVPYPKTQSGYLTEPMGYLAPCGAAVVLFHTVENYSYTHHVRWVRRGYAPEDLDVVPFPKQDSNTNMPEQGYLAGHLRFNDIVARGDEVLLIGSAGHIRDEYHSDNLNLVLDVATGRLKAYSRRWYCCTPGCGSEEGRYTMCSDGVVETVSLEGD